MERPDLAASAIHGADSPPSVVVSSLQMPRARSCALRVVALMVALAMLVIVAHTHANGPAGRCDVCQTAHVVAHQATAPARIDPRPLHGRMALERSFGAYETLFRLVFFTRGPPLLTL